MGTSDILVYYTNLAANRCGCSSLLTLPMCLQHNIKGKVHAAFTALDALLLSAPAGSGLTVEGILIT